jgi:hypothetical protein
MFGAAAAVALGGLWVLGYGISHWKALVTLLEALLYENLTTHKLALLLDKAFSS